MKSRKQKRKVDGGLGVIASVRKQRDEKYRKREE